MSDATPTLDQRLEALIKLRLDVEDPAALMRIAMSTDVAVDLMCHLLDDYIESQALLDHMTDHPDYDGDWDHILLNRRLDGGAA